MKAYFLFRHGVLSTCLLSVHVITVAQNILICTNQNGHREYRDAGSTNGCSKQLLPQLNLAPGLPKPPTSGSAATISEGAKDSARGGPGSGPDQAHAANLRRLFNAEREKFAALQAEFNGGEPERHGDERNYAKYQERVAAMQEALTRSKACLERLSQQLDRAGNDARASTP
jgi:hypothetical protein